jgi:2-polyprenyl-3-methyl-5-hydroxy-6-metoxy-1,4-benzoquinol methylase
MKSQSSNQHHRETLAAWNQNAAFWDDHMGEGNDFVNVLIWPATERLLELRKGERILDIACGNGLFARKLAALGAQVVAFDFSEEMISHAVARTKVGLDRIQYHLIDATDESALLNLGEGKYDAALCNMALFDIADIYPLIFSLSKLLKQGGRFIFSMLHPCFNNSHATMVAEMQDREGDIETVYSVKVSGYMSPTVSRGVAIDGQPQPQLYFHRPLQDLLNACFEVGFVLNGFEERAFPAGHQGGRHHLSWGGHFNEIPPVLVARMLLIGR